MSEDRILERVRKMLALANDGAASEGERDTALRMAYNLLAKHQLDLEDVNAFEKEKIDPRGKFTLDGWNIPWCRDIRAAVADLFMCTYYWKKINATKGRHTFVGRESNATTCMYMGDFIVLGLLREADKRYGHRLTPQGRSFGTGAADKLWQRVIALRKEKQAEISSGGSALVLINLAKSEEQANRDLIVQSGTKLKKAKERTTKVSASAYHAGIAHGATISLNTQVANKKGTLAIQ